MTATDLRPLSSVDRRDRAAALLEHPLRLAVLRHADEPRSATEIAHRLGETRQKVNYHLGKLRDADFVRAAGSRPRRGLEEHLYVATARHYALSPDVLGPLAPSPRAVTDRLSADYLVALAARTQAEVTRAAAEAEARGRRLATLSIDADVHFADAGSRAAFTRDLHQAVIDLVARHSRPAAPGARPHRLVVGAHPVPEAADSEPSDPEPSDPGETP